MRTSVILFATDLVDEGYELLVDRVRDLGGADALTMACNYHHSRDVMPHNPKRKVQFMKGGVFFRPDPRRFAGLRIQPDVADIARDDDPLDRLIRTAERRGLRVKAWTNGMHSTVHASAHPDCAVSNLFGDVYITTLCPANPDVRAYARAMAADLGRYPLEAYLAESVCFMPFDHGYHHERTLVPISATVKYLLSLCFCRHCRAAARGVAVDVLQATLRAAVERALNGEDGPLDGLALDRATVAALAGGEMAGYLDAREATVTSLVSELAEASGRVPLHVMEWSGGLRAVGGGMPVKSAEGTACDRAWQDGVDLARLAAAGQGLSVLGYVPDPATLRDDLMGVGEARTLAGGVGTGMSEIWPGRFRDRVMLVTGGASGIGRATVERAAAEGAAVIILDRNGDAASRLAAALASAGHRACAVVADITDDRQVATAVAEGTAALGAIDLLINNAGAVSAETFEASDPAGWRADIDLNLTGAWLVTRAALPHLLRRGGAIVNVATVNALTAVAEPAYSAAKAGLLQLTRQLAIEYGPRGVRANAVVPGSIRTPIWDERLATRPGLLDDLAKWYPVGRVGRPEEVAAAILFLASAEAGFVNGASLVVDGGLTVGLGPMMREIRGPAAG